MCNSTDQPCFIPFLPAASLTGMGKIRVGAHCASSAPPSVLNLLPIVIERHLNARALDKLVENGSNFHNTKGVYLTFDSKAVQIIL
mmetsp:Transcript_1450/g.2666  ORF Transcript_1450/g.2666 Transcript_1450/m.2666 type:complete len:86 (+) Transcript_1450:3017-3274(+)